jgi:hypothetical protein
VALRKMRGWRADGTGPLQILVETKLDFQGMREVTEGF